MASAGLLTLFVWNTKNIQLNVVQLYMQVVCFNIGYTKLVRSDRQQNGDTHFPAE